MNRRAAIAWAALLGSLWLVMVLCTHWEPIVRDGWANLHYQRTHDVDLAEAWRLVVDGWLGSNPRLGQTVTTLLYAEGPYHVIITPLLLLATLAVMTALVLGRWPSRKRLDDALAFATVTAVFALCTPQFGPMLFYRPFMGNYTFGFLLNLLWLVPFRLHVESPRSWDLGLAPLLLLLGVAAGMCNEHTGPAFLGLGAAATWWSWKQGALKPWMVAGLVGLAAGYVLLLVAPGHDARYGGLAKQAGMLGRVLERGAGENAKILGMLVVYLAWSLPWLALGFVARTCTQPEPLPPLARRALLGLAAGGLLATFALLASPKLGPRLYLQSVGLVAMAIAGAVLAQLGSGWAKKACAALTIAALLYCEARLVITYRACGAVSDRRVELISTAAPGSTVVVPRYPYGAGKWFLGEDFGVDGLRESIQRDWGVTIELAK